MHGPERRQHIPSFASLKKNGFWEYAGTSNAETIRTAGTGATEEDGELGTCLWSSCEPAGTTAPAAACEEGPSAGEASIAEVVGECR